MRFYEICKEKERFKTFEYTVEHLKEMFSIENKYKNYFDFKVKVIVQARNKLKENSELYFDFDEIKQGKKVVSLRFTVIKNKKICNTLMIPHFLALQTPLRFWLTRFLSLSKIITSAYEQSRSGLKNTLLFKSKKELIIRSAKTKKVLTYCISILKFTLIF